MSPLVARLRLAAAGCLLMALCGACGLPDGGTARQVPAAEVPYGLLATATSLPTPTSTPTRATIVGTLYLVDAQQRLVPLSVRVPESSIVALVQALLTRLSAGPTEADRSRGLQTDLGQGASLTLRSVSSGLATIELRTSSQDPSPRNLPVAIGQVVLTATSVVGVEQVRFVLDGNAVSVPAPPAGDLSSRPLSQADYLALLAPGSVVPAPAVPLPAPNDVPTSPPSPSNTTTSAG